MREFETRRFDDIYEKSLPLADPALATKRLIHEALNTNLAYNINNIAQNPLEIPGCTIILTENQPTKLIIPAIIFEHLGNFSPTPLFKILLERLNLGSAMALGFLLADPDRPNNIGINHCRVERASKISYLDCGLADYSWLQKNNLLLRKEQGRLPRGSEEDAFNISTTLLVNILQQKIIDYVNNCEFVFALHHYEGFHQLVNELHLHSNEIKRAFLNQIATMIDAYIQVVLAADFKQSLIQQTFLEQSIPAEYVPVINTLLNRMIQRGEALQSIQQEIQLDIKKLDAIVLHLLKIPSPILGHRRRPLIDPICKASLKELLIHNQEHNDALNRVYSPKLFATRKKIRSPLSARLFEELTQCNQSNHRTHHDPLFPANKARLASF